ncbi:hypothetical protein [Faecalimicrobium sp. JNUCC 81]
MGNEIKIKITELETQISNLRASIDKLSPYTNSFISNTRESFEGFNSDFISKVDSVIKHLGDDTAKNIIKKTESICNDTKVISDSFKELDNEIKSSINK